MNIGEFARFGQVSPRMLRHYDEIGLLKPKEVDPHSGYRSYEAAQLGRLHRLLALRDLGFSLDQTRQLLDDQPSLEQLHGMLQLRQAQIEKEVAAEQARLRRVEAHLRALEGGIEMSSLDVAVKTTQPVHVAEASGEAPGFGHENLGPVFNRLVPRVLAHLARVDARPGTMIAWYEEPSDDGSVVLHVGFDIGDQSVPDGEGISVHGLPRTEVAAVVHRGTMEQVTPVYEALVRWIEDSGYQISGASRELYHDWNELQPEQSVTELQMPLVV